jgi:hypothetical protein
VATSVNCGIPLWVDDPAMDASTPFRTYEIGTKVYNGGTTAANQIPGGVFPGMGAMAVNAAGGMNISVNAGYCCCPNSSSALQGAYVFGLMNAQTFALNAASATLPRIDIVVANVADLGTDASAAYVQVITGTPAAAPTPPAAPANSITLAQILVGAGVTSVTAANVTDVRSYVVAPGGILPIQSEAFAPAVPATQFLYNIATNQLVTGTGTAGSVTLPSILPWAPQVAVGAANVFAGSAGASASVLSVSATTTGEDLEIYIKWTGVEGSAQYIAMNVTVDGALAGSLDVVSLGTTSYATAGGSAHFYTSSAQGNTPVAGTHTIAWSFQAGGAGTSVHDGIIATATSPSILRVAPVST